jgi:trk system potassium uptake protein TrkH
VKKPFQAVVRRLSGWKRTTQEYCVAWFETFLMRTILSSKRPFQTVSAGFLAYILLGILALSPPISRSHDLGLTDIAFMVTSAVSTTGLTTVSTGDSFTFFGEFVLLLLFQVGGLGFMTLRSFIAFSTGHRLAPDQAKTWSVGFSLPSGVDMRGFIRHIVVFSLILETLGAIVLYFEFAAAGVENAAWSAVFHSVSAFATAGFSLWNSGLEGFRGSVWVNLTVGALCYFGSIGFIVLQDFYMAVRNRSHRISFTSKIILVMTWPSGSSMTMA